MNINSNYNAMAFTNVVNTVRQRAIASTRSMGRRVSLGRTILEDAARHLFPADADAVAAATASATLRQAFGRASTVVDGQPLGLPGQKVAGHAPVADGR